MKIALQELISRINSVEVELRNIKHRLVNIAETDPTVLILEQLKHQEKLLMAISDKEQKLLDRFDAATTKIAAELKDLKDQVKNSGASTDEIDAAFDAKIAQLEALGSDPNQPIPPELETGTSSSDTGTSGTSGNQ